MAEARGVALLLAAENNLKVVEFPLGSQDGDDRLRPGRKNQVRKMVLAMLKIENDKKLDDEIDAIAIALTCPAKNYPQ